MGLLGRTKGDALFDSNISYSTGDRLLFDIRRYMRAVVALHVLFVSVIVLTFGLVWHQISQYELVKSENLNTVNEYVVNTLSNANTMSNLAVPIVTSLQYVSIALATTVQSLTNISAPVTGRRLAQTDAATAARDDEHMRKMVYKQVRVLLEKANEQLGAFNVTNVNTLLAATATQVQSINFTGFADRYDRTLEDLEQTAHFGTLASVALGLVSHMMNTSAPRAADVAAAIGQALPSAAP